MSAIIRYCTMVISLFLCIAGVAQSSFLPVELHKSDQTVVYGFLRYSHWQYLPNRIEFRPTEDAKSEFLGPSEVDHFTVNEERYVSAITMVEMSYIGNTNLDDKELRLRKDTIFLRNLVDGPKALFYHKNRSNGPFFYIKKEESYELLKFKEFVEYAASGNTSNQLNIYKNQLVSYLSDCRSVQNILKDAEYNLNSLIEVFVNYYQCRGGNPEYVVEKEKLTAKFGVLIGGGITDLDISGSSALDRLTKASFQTVPAAVVGVTLIIRPPRNWGRFSLSNDVFLTKYRAEGSATVSLYAINPSILTEVNTTFGATSLLMSNSIQYELRGKQVSLLLQAGIVNGLVLSFQNEIDYEDNFDQNNITQVNRPAIDNYRKNEQGFQLAVGVQRSDWIVEMRLLQTKGISRIKTLAGNISRKVLVVKYLL